MRRERKRCVKAEVMRVDRLKDTMRSISKREEGSIWKEK